MKLKTFFTIFVLVFFSACSHSVSRQKVELARKYADKGTRNLMMGNLEQAKSEFDLSLEITPLPEGYDGLGCVAFYKKDYAEAEKYFIEAYNQDKKYIRALSNLALLYDALNLKKEARKVYEFTLLKSPQDYRSRNNFAGFLFDNEKDKNSDIVKEELRKAYSLRGDDIIKRNLEKMGEKIDVTKAKEISIKKEEKKKNSVKKITVDDFKF